MDENIKQEFKKLDLELYKIQCRNWILSKGNGTGAAGKTLEVLLGKETDRYILPDINSIEIKTRSENTKYPMSLFSCACDNKPLEMKRLLDIGGYPDKKDPRYKVFFLTINGKEYTDFGKYSYKVSVDINHEELELIILNRYTRKRYTTMSWSFRELKSRLTCKLSYMALIMVKKDIIEGQTYFKYYDAKYYKLKDFRSFLDLIESGHIYINFNISYDHRSENYGAYLDRGTSFEIQIKDIPKLFDRVEVA